MFPARPRGQCSDKSRTNRRQRLHRPLLTSQGKSLQSMITSIDGISIGTSVVITVHTYVGIRSPCLVANQRCTNKDRQSSKVQAYRVRKKHDRALPGEDHLPTWLPYSKKIEAPSACPWQWLEQQWKTLTNVPLCIKRLAFGVSWAQEV